jgi:hypothetical protein
MGPSAFLLGPGEGAKLAIERPAPGEAQRVNVDPASVNAFAVGALAWTLLSTAAKHLSLPTATQSCIAAAVYASLSSPPQPEEALRRMHACVNASRLSRNAERFLRKLASRLLLRRFFREVIHREGTEPRWPSAAYMPARASAVAAPGGARRARRTAKRQPIVSALSGSPPPAPPWRA